MSMIEKYQKIVDTVWEKVYVQNSPLEAEDTEKLAESFAEKVAKKYNTKYCKWPGKPNRIKDCMRYFSANKALKYLIFYKI